MAVDSMVGMAVGWAFGDASLETLTELSRNRALPELLQQELVLNFGYAAILTLACAMVLAIVEPLTGHDVDICRAAGLPIPPNEYSSVTRKHALWIRGRLRPLWCLLSRATEVMVMATWAFALRRLIVSGVVEDDSGGADRDGEREEELYERVLLLWAIALTGICAVCVTKLERCRLLLHERVRDARASECAEASAGYYADGYAVEYAGEGTSDDYYTGRLRHPLAPVDRVAHLRAAARGAVCAVAVQIFSLIEGALGWVTGCAWTDAVVAWTPLASYPTVSVMMKDAGVTLLLTLFGVSWLIATRASNQLADEKKGDRSEVEKFFFTKAMTFFVGWRYAHFLRFCAVRMLCGCCAGTCENAW